MQGGESGSAVGPGLGSGMPQVPATACQDVPNLRAHVACATHTHSPSVKAKHMARSTAAGRGTYSAASEVTAKEERLKGSVDVW